MQLSKSRWDAWWQEAWETSKLLVPMIAVWALIFIVVVTSGCGGKNVPQASPALQIVVGVVKAACPGADDPLAIAKDCQKFALADDRPGLLNCIIAECWVTPTDVPPPPRPRPEPRTEPSAEPRPVASPTTRPVPPVVEVQPPQPVFVNGGDASNPRSMGPDGVVGFTVFYHCPGCGNWPADQDHAHWLPPDEPGIFTDDQGNRHGPFGACTNNGDSSDQLCHAVHGRAWDPTCASIGGSFIVPLSGTAHADQYPGRNCYSAILSGHGTYQVCLAAGAKACKDPHDYINDEDWVNGCKHGEVRLTDHAICSAPIRVDR